jgi:hypothetical protein
MIFRGILGLIAIAVLRVLLEVFNFSRSADTVKSSGRQDNPALKLLMIYAGLFLFAWFYFLPGIPSPNLSFWMDASVLVGEERLTVKLQAQTALVLAAMPLVFDLVIMLIASAFKRWNKSIIAIALAVDIVGFCGFWFGLGHLVQIQ